MTDEKKRISKSLGLTPTEQFLSTLCDSTFLKLWSYPNPFREPGKELCDLIAVFENHVYLFFDRENKALVGKRDDFNLAWARWKKEAITKQIKSAKKATIHISNTPDKVFLDAKCTIKFPIKIPTEAIKIHIIIVAHGASQACKAFSPHNLSGSLAVIYGDDVGMPSPPSPFIVHLGRREIVHLFDSHTLEIILGELDTFYDLTDYIVAKETSINRIKNIVYMGEEDLLADYYSNFDRRTKKHFIGTQDETYDCVFIPEGKWLQFTNSEPYKRKKLADRISYLWDDLLQRTTQNALDGTLLGDGGIYESQSAIFEMAKEPRFSRRALAEAMQKAIRNFPEEGDGITTNLSFMPSYYAQTAYIFLQVKYPNDADYTMYRPKRQVLLEIACGVAKNKFHNLTKVVGIAIDAPKFARVNSEDFILLKCTEWRDEDRRFYEEQNKQLHFFESAALKKEVRTVRNFPRSEKTIKQRKIGRNDLCPCGLGKKYKNCHGR
jgi:hypothetical protein